MAGSAGRETGLEQWSSNNPSIVYRVCCVAWLSIRPSMNELGSSRKCTGGFPCLARIRRHKDFQVSFTCDDLLCPVVVSFPGFQVCCAVYACNSIGYQIYLNHSRAVASISVQLYRSKLTSWDSNEQDIQQPGPPVLYKRYSFSALNYDLF